MWQVKFPDFMVLFFFKTRKKVINNPAKDLQDTHEKMVSFIQRITRRRTGRVTEKAVLVWLMEFFLRGGELS